MSSPEAINGAIDALIAVITANLTTLGLTAVTEPDQEPRYLAPPEAYVIPFVEGIDSIKILSGGEEHTYPINVVGFYKYVDIQTGLRPVRTYGLTALDLFTRSNGTLHFTMTGGVKGGAEVNDTTLEVGYWRTGDYIMHYWQLGLQIRQIV